MNVHLTTTNTDSQTQRRRQRVVAGGLALLAAAAIGSWQVATHRDSASPTTIQQGITSNAPVTRQIVTPNTVSDRLLTVYIAGSEDEAAFLRKTLDDGDQILNQLGQPLFNAQVVVAATENEAAGLRQALDEASNIRAGMGLPPITVIDTRPR